MAILKQSTAYTRMFLLVDSADHVSGKTGATPTVTLSKAGGAFGALGGSVTEVSGGWYKISLNTTDTNTLGDLAYHVTASGADNTDFVDQVSARINDDFAYPATSGRSMVVDAAGLVDANVVKLGPSGSGTAQTARDIGASVLLSSGTGTGQISLSSGLVSLAAGQLFIKKNTALNNFEFLMTDDTTHAPATGLTITSERSIDGSALAATTNSASEISNGLYKINLSAADLNGSVISFRFSATGADDLVFTVVTQA